MYFKIFQVLETSVALFFGLWLGDESSELQKVKNTRDISWFPLQSENTLVPLQSKRL